MPKIQLTHPYCGDKGTQSTSVALIDPLFVTSINTLCGNFLLCPVLNSLLLFVSKKDTNEYPNIFLSKNDTNEYQNIFVSRKLIRTNVRINIRIENIRIFKYIRHTLIPSLGVLTIIRRGSHKTSMVLKMRDASPRQLVG